MASRAGSRVIEASTITSTITETAIAPAVMNGTPATVSPRIATTTMPPASTTDAPAVETARAIDSGTGTPAVRCSRCRVRMNRA